MQDKKYATVQFTVNDLAKIKSAQAYLETELGFRISLAQTVMYGIDKIERLAAIERKQAQYEAMEANMKAAQEAQAYYAANPDHKPPTIEEILGQMIKPKSEANTKTEYRSNTKTVEVKDGLLTGLRVELNDNEQEANQ